MSGSNEDSLNGWKPVWFRADVGIAQHPKLLELRFSKQHEAAWLYLDSIGYATEHLTDGWIPLWFPQARGFRPRDADALVRVGLWHQMEIGDCGGWLIHDYLAHQKSKDQWITEQHRRKDKARRAAEARWDK
jgi:hypothetical protein